LSAREGAVVRITNTSKIPDGVARAIIRFAARELEVTDYVRVVELKDTKNLWRGICWGRRVLLRVGQHGFPRLGFQYRKNAPVYDVMDPLEALAKLAGHEFGHSRQFLSQAKTGIRKKHSEVEAEQQAFYVLSRFRERRAEIVGLAEALAEGQRAQAVEKEQAAACRAPAKKLTELEARVASWRTRAKRANTLLKKWERRLRRAQKAVQQ
jgi:hypothetical protein